MNFKTRKKHILITRMRNEVGDIKQRGKELLTHLQLFYENPYSGCSDEEKDEEDNEGRVEDICDHTDDNFQKY